ncbi:uncharacterized protein LOC105640616 isoform X3 [Jatropha curcas]|uniref:uncharacterized protein LOC105640616 isoform X3 n=1 Tax=Jatropha curcas TaxID=180498 RepID=UPI0018952308|nr:uncharacterized protein LOC105640616 isoform X3 [Jatropha curcas]
MGVVLQLNRTHDHWLNSVMFVVMAVLENVLYSVIVAKLVYMCIKQGSLETNPRGTSLIASKSSSTGVAILESNEISPIEEEPTKVGDDASSKGKGCKSVNQSFTEKFINLEKVSTEAVKQAAERASCPSLAMKKPSFSLRQLGASVSLRHLGDEAEQAVHGIPPPSFLTGKSPQLPDYSGKKKQAINEKLSAPIPANPLSSSSHGDKKSIYEVVTLTPLGVKSQLSPRLPRNKLSGRKRYYDGKPITSDIEESHDMYYLLDFWKYPSNRPMLEAAWNGSFEILDKAFAGKFYGDFEAHLPQYPCIVDRRVHQFSKNMPRVLRFELLPRCNIWAETFKSDFAPDDDISLYFFPGTFESPKQQFDHLWRVMEKEDLVMRSSMNGVELLVFTSKRLQNAKEFNWEPFLWGVFRIMKNKNVSTSISTNKPSQIHAFGVGTTIKPQSSMQEIKRLNDHEVPPGFSGKGATKAANEATFDDPEVPPGFSGKGTSKAANEATFDDPEVPPGFSGKGASKAANEATFDDPEVPPGFCGKGASKAANEATFDDPEVPPGFSGKGASKAANEATFDDHEVPPGFSGKGASGAANEATFDESGLVEVPVKLHPALVPPPHLWSKIARPAKIARKEIRRD